MARDEALDQLRLALDEVAEIPKRLDVWKKAFPIIYNKCKPLCEILGYGLVKPIAENSEPYPFVGIIGVTQEEELYQDHTYVFEYSMGALKFVRDPAGAIRVVMTYPWIEPPGPRDPVEEELAVWINGEWSSEAEVFGMVERFARKAMEMLPHIRKPHEPTLEYKITMGFNALFEKLDKNQD